MKCLFLCAIMTPALLAACDESQAWHTPEPSLARMQDQPRIDPYDRAATVAPPDTVARDEAPTSRPLITRDLIEQGRETFEIYCATCHGDRGDGHSIVATKMQLRAPPSLIDPNIAALSDGRIESIAEKGYGLMPSFASEIPLADRWAVVAYVRALQATRVDNVAALPNDLREDLARRP
jgi:mono/diheme cytochrome c family protein